MTTSQQVSDASTELGLLLAIVALFTAALSSTLQSEMTRETGAHQGARRRIMAMSAALATVSAASLTSLLSLVRAISEAYGTRSWEPAFWVFLLVYLLLVPLCVWQVSICVGAFRHL